MCFRPFSFALLGINEANKESDSRAVKGALMRVYFKAPSEALRPCVLTAELAARILYGFRTVAGWILGLRVKSEQQLQRKFRLRHQVLTRHGWFERISREKRMQMI